MGRWIVAGLQVLLALAFAASGAQKLVGALEPMREHLGVAPWFWVLTALVELAGAAGMLAGLRSARVAVFSGLWIAALMVGALAAHVRVGDPLAAMIPAAVLLVLALAVARIRWESAEAPNGRRSGVGRTDHRVEKGGL